MSVGLLLVGIFVLGIYRWKTSLRLLFWTTIVEGILRKWIFPQHEMELYFLKDIQLAGVVAGFCRENQLGGVTRLLQRWPAWLKALFYLLIFYCMAEVFNPFVAMPSITWFGLKAYLFYVIVTLLLPEIWTNHRQIQRDLMWMSCSVIPLCFLCGIQYYAAAGSWINVYANPAVPTSSIASQNFHSVVGNFIAIRATGTFSYIGTAGSYFIVMAFVISLLVFLRERWCAWKVILLALAYSADLLGAVFTGSRAPVGVIGIIITTTLLIQVGANLQFRRKLWQWRLGVLTAGILLVLSLWASGSGLVFLRFINSGDCLERVSSAFAVFSTHAIEAPWLKFFGGGIGLTHPGEIALLHRLYPDNPASLTYYGEAGKYRMTTEMGLFGYYLFLIFHLGVIGYCLRLVLQRGSTSERYAIATAGIFLVLCLFLTLTSDYIMNLGFWFAIGAVISIASLLQAKSEEF
jgi:hypothetical protein